MRSQLLLIVLALCMVASVLAESGIDPYHW
jgi:hypothetical protein